MNTVLVFDLIESGSDARELDSLFYFLLFQFTTLHLKLKAKADRRTVSAVQLRIRKWREVNWNGKIRKKIFQFDSLSLSLPLYFKNSRVKQTHFPNLVDSCADKTGWSSYKWCCQFVHASCAPMPHSGSSDVHNAHSLLLCSPSLFHTIRLVVAVLISSLGASCALFGHHTDVLLLVWRKC